ncbi:hypothetical protein [Sphingomonas sp. 35-24ZXX]|uniref:hypothetical protein n=1 Tax=Sphingomonas sp. 35-24ZXX TaxID=1545915 RepID=UPI00053C0036|nr:hypothetical protein [Sphingomonas sp. 35-24ZXX]
MNAITLNLVEEAARGWEAMDDQVHLWRGRCIDCFTEAERSISQTLIFLREHFGHEFVVKQGHLFGQKLTDLGEAFAQPKIQEIKTAKKAAQALERFVQYAELRKDLCHGDMTVYANRQGLWLAQFKVICLGSQTVKTHQMVIDHDSADETLKLLRKTVQSLCKCLANFMETPPESTVSPSSPSAPAAPASR